MARVQFLLEFLLAPDTLGSVTPSSRALSDAVVAAAEVFPGHRVVELGGGTGPVTDALTRRHPDADLVVFEPVPTLAKVLQHRLPQIDVRVEPAGADLAQRVASGDGRPVDRVVSGLPWTMWPAPQQAAVLDGIVRALAPTGRFVTYTYLSSVLSPAGFRFRRLVESRFARVGMTPVVWSNLPPAVVLVADGPIGG